MTRSYQRASTELRKNPGQWAAYESAGNCAVLAGPGSGKTKTLTIKLARMLAEDVTPSRGIACLTFSNECARELRRRIAVLGIEDSERLFIGTVHSFCLKHVVIPYARIAKVDLPTPLKVATTSEQNRIFEGALTRIMGESARSSQFRMPIDAYRRTHLDRTGAEWREDPNYAAVIEEYERGLRQENLVDFEDMVLIGLRLIEGQSWVRNALRAKFPILAIDEYQDLGVPLHRIVLKLCFDGHVRLFAVGDADQSIYGFTGSRPELLQELSERSDVESISLRFNYRSASEIVAASETALGQSRGYAALSEEKGIIDFHYFPEGLAQQAFEIINTLIPSALDRVNGRRLGDIAVLYTNYSDGNLISGFAAEAGLDFLRIDSGAPIPSTPLIRWIQECAEWCAGGWTLSRPRIQTLIRRWSGLAPSLKDDRETTRALVRTLFGTRNAKLPLEQWLRWLDTEFLSPRFDENENLRDETQNFRKLLKLTEPGGQLADATVGSFAGTAGSPEHLNLITLHSAKGLEYDVVFLMGMDEGRLPSWSDKTRDALTEARRRFYVGITRAKREVHITYSGFTTDSYGRIHRNGPSRFLTELQQKLR